MTREKLLKSPVYWFEYEQNELFRQVSEYMERENINQTELAAKLNVSKGYISQILNGNFNYTLKKLIELCLAIDLVPQIKFTKVEEVIKKDAQLKSYHDNVEIFNSNGNEAANRDVGLPKREKVNDFKNIELAPTANAIKKTKKVIR
jgi:transcriptional regulator with XRE-family HTH domain